MASRVEYHPTIKELPLAERPRERLREHGASSLSNAELLAIILRTGAASKNVLDMASRLLARFGGLAGLGKVMGVGGSGFFVFYCENGDNKQRLREVI